MMMDYIEKIARRVWGRPSKAQAREMLKEAYLEACRAYADGDRVRAEILAMEVELWDVVAE